MLRIRRRAFLRLEFRPVPGAETATQKAERPAFFTPLLDLLAPSRCGVCDAARVDLGGGGVCRACWASLPLLDTAAACPCCALPGSGALCASCRLSPPSVTRTAAFGLYAGGLRTLHHAFKFAGWDLLAAPLGERLAALALRRGITDGAHALVSVPSTARRNRERGYDPAVLLADETSRHLDTPHRAFLFRRRDAPPQSSLPASGRHANVKGAFGASSRAHGRVLVLVDDVATTGATLFSAADALCAAGAAEVRALVLARTPESA